MQLWIFLSKTKLSFVLSCFIKEQFSENSNSTSPKKISLSVSISFALIVIAKGPKKHLLMKDQFHIKLSRRSCEWGYTGKIKTITIWISKILFSMKCRFHMKKNLKDRINRGAHEIYEKLKLKKNKYFLWKIVFT